MDVVDVVKISGEAAFLKALVDVGPISVLFYSTENFQSFYLNPGIYDSDTLCSQLANNFPGKLSMFYLKNFILENLLYICKI